MPKFTVIRYRDAYVRHARVVEADTAEEAQAKAADLDDGWEERGTAEFHHCEFEVYDEDEESLLVEMH